MSTLKVLNNTIQIFSTLMGLEGKDIADLKSDGLTYIPYIPLTIALTTDDKTFEPVVAFRTRHTILEESDQ